MVVADIAVSEAVGHDLFGTFDVLCHEVAGAVARRAAQPVFEQCGDATNANTNLKHPRGMGSFQQRRRGGREEGFAHGPSPEGGSCTTTGSANGFDNRSVQSSSGTLASGSMSKKYMRWAFLPFRGLAT